MDELIKLIEEWAYDKNLNSADPAKQFLKVSEEVGEIAAALARSNMNDLRDAIGDTVVTLIILSIQNDMDLYECLNTAYDEIKNRTGQTVNGVFVKQEDIIDGQLNNEVWEKLSPREKLIRVGYSEQHLDEMLKEYPDTDSDEVYSDELSYAAENSI